MPSISANPPTSAYENIEVNDGTSRGIPQADNNINEQNESTPSPSNRHSMIEKSRSQSEAIPVSLCASEFARDRGNST